MRNNRNQKLYAFVSSKSSGGDLVVECYEVGEPVRDLLEASDGKDVVTVEGIWLSDKAYEDLEEFGGW
jgi:hypothetical protein